MKNLDEKLIEYIDNEIVPQYSNFDNAHQINHVKDVIFRSLSLAEHYDVNVNMVYAIAAFHDTGLCEGRELHHIISGKIIMNNCNLRRWFSDEQISIMAQAAEDHRASSDHEPRSIYGKIVAEADRLIDPKTVIQRTILYGLSHYPQYDKEEHYLRFKNHMKDKYSDSGYIKLWLPESENTIKLEELRRLIREESKLQEAFSITYQELISGSSEK
jgi:HD domain.